MEKPKESLSLLFRTVRHAGAQFISLKRYGTSGMVNARSTVDFGSGDGGIAARTAFDEGIQNGEKTFGAHPPFFIQLFVE